MLNISISLATVKASGNSTGCARFLVYAPPNPFILAIPEPMSSYQTHPHASYQVTSLTLDFPRSPVSQIVKHKSKLCTSCSRGLHFRFKSANLAHRLLPPDCQPYSQCFHFFGRERASRYLCFIHQDTTNHFILRKISIVPSCCTTARQSQK